jgi:hypothetical protein
MSEDKRQEDALQEVVDFVMGWNAEHALMALGQAAATIIVYMAIKDPGELGRAGKVDEIYEWFISSLAKSIVTIVKNYPTCQTRPH